jgi:iron complex outermembrane receptor protein
MDGDWTLRVIGRYSDREGDKSPSYAQGRPVPVDASGAIVKYTNAAGVQVNSDNRYTAADDPRVADWRATLVMRDFRGYNESYVVNADLTGDFLTGPLHHKTVLSMGLTGSEGERAFFFWNAPNPANTTAVANSFSAVQKTPPNVTAASIKASGATKQFNNLNGYSSGWNFSTSVLDNVSLWKERIIASVGWRFDNAHAESGAFDAAKSIAADDLILNSTTLTKTANSQNTFRYGLVGKPIKNVSIFGQISSTFVPVTGTNVLTGEPLKNRDGKNKEIGLKVDLLGGRVTGTVSYFDSQLTNVLVPVILPIDQGGGTVSLPVGSQNSFGWEMDIAAEPVRGLNVMAGYSDVTSRDERGFAFRGVPIVPSYSLMARYSVATDSALKGFYLGASMKHRGASPGDATRTFYVGSGDEYDAFAGYGRGRWSLQLNVQNLTDSETAWSAVSDQLLVRLLPRSYRLTFRYTF